MSPRQLRKAVQLSVSQSPLVEQASQNSQIVLQSSVSQGTQVEPADVTVTEGQQFQCMLQALEKAATYLGISTATREALSTFIHSSRLSLEISGTPLRVKSYLLVVVVSGYVLQIHQSNAVWSRHYSVLSFMVNGQLYAEYKRVSGMLGLPPCSDKTWSKILERLEVDVKKLADWSCDHVRDNIHIRGDKDKWIASFDGFYLTRGHYSNNCSATLHDFATGKMLQHKLSH